MSVDTARAFAARGHGPLVGGEWVGSRGGGELAVEDPSTEEQLGTAAVGGAPAGAFESGWT